MTYGEGTRELNLLVPVPMGCFGYVLDRNSVDGRFYARRVTVTGYFVVADGVVEARVLSEAGKVLWFKTREVFPSRWEAESKIPQYEQMFGGPQSASEII